MVINNKLREQFNRFNQWNWGQKTRALSSNEHQIKFRFKRGNLLIDPIKNLSSSFQKYYLVLGISEEIDWSNKIEHFYLVKVSSSSRPSLLSKGHKIMTVNIEDTNKHYKISIREAFKDL